MHAADMSPGDPGYYLDVVRHMIMPAVVLSLGSMATLTRYQRSSMLEVIRQNYVQTARAKGLSERVVIYKHALRNAMVPVITMVGLLIPQFIGGSYITETVFGWPGIGRLGVNAIFQRDYAVVMGVTMLSSLIVIVANMLTDLAYAFINPRIRYE
jgi:peptide/nickel transport system permease protein